MSISRRGFLGSLGAAALGCSGGAKEAPLNVLFIASDDLTSTTLGCYGHPLVKSPHIDSLATRGVRFENAYCQFPFCGPSRASLMTGLRPNTTGITTNGNVDFRATRPDTVTLPQMFKNNDYRSMRVGKLFHMGVPGGVGSMRHQDPPSWDVSISPPGDEDKSIGEGGDPTPDYRNGLKMQWVRTADASGQADSAAADTAIELLEETGGDPFFLGLGFVRPHVPFVAPAEFFDMYPLEDIELAINPPDDLDDIPTPAKNLRSFLWNHMGMSEEDQRVSLQGYYASTSFMDQQVGRVLDTVERLGQADRTVVVFFGDHGWHLGEHTHWQKMSLMEESAKAPLIIAAPGARGAGQSTKALAEFIDFYPTLADLCALEPPDDLDGVSLRPILDDPTTSVKDAAFTQIEWAHSDDPRSTAGGASNTDDRIYGRTMRTDRYRYIHWAGDGGGEELYDHDNDPGEFTNLAGSPEHAEILSQLRVRLDAGLPS